MFWNKKKEQKPVKEKFNVKRARFELHSNTNEKRLVYYLTVDGKANLNVCWDDGFNEDPRVITYSPEEVLLKLLSNVYCKYIQTDDSNFVKKSTITSFAKISEEDLFVEV